MTPGLAAQVPTNADLDRVVGGFREICPLAETKGVTLCYGGALPATQLRRMEKAIASEAFGYSLDVADTAWRGLDTATEIRALGKLIAQVRMKETRSTPGDCRPGLGRVNYAESAKALDEIGYQGWLVMGTPVGPAELVRRDISFTRAVFSNLAPAGPWPLLGAFSWDFPRGALDRLISEFKRCGLRSVQLAGGLLDEALEDPAFASLLAVKLEQNGIRIAGLAGYRNMVAPDPEKRRMHLDYLKRCLEIAPRLGTSVVASETGTFHPESDWKDAPENSSEQAWNRLYQALDQLLPVAEKHGSILALEGYVANVLKTASQLLGLLERFPTEHLQVVLDPFNYLSKELLPVRERITREFLDQFEPRFVLAHLKDVSADGAEVSTPEFGQGVFSYQPYFDFLRARRPDLPIILEHLAFDRMPAAIQRFQAMNID
jgi:sugar phosphate isomerase/epimerase